jgi:hypothetical protein
VVDPSPSAFWESRGILVMPGMTVRRDVGRFFVQWVDLETWEEFPWPGGLLGGPDEIGLYLSLRYGLDALLNFPEPLCADTWPMMGLEAPGAFADDVEAPCDIVEAWTVLAGVGRGDEGDVWLLEVWYERRSGEIECADVVECALGDMESFLDLMRLPARVGFPPVVHRTCEGAGEMESGEVPDGPLWPDTGTNVWEPLPHSDRPVLPPPAHPGKPHADRGGSAGGGAGGGAAGPCGAPLNALCMAVVALGGPTTGAAPKMGPSPTPGPAEDAACARQAGIECKAMGAQGVCYSWFDVVGPGVTRLCQYRCKWAGNPCPPNPHTHT